jgi:L-fuconolactonase
MEIVDAQIHVFDEDNERYPWSRGPEFERRQHSITPFRYEEALAAMDEAGVAAAALVIPGTYGNENGYLLEAAARHPDRFAVVGRIASSGPDVASRLAAWVAASPAVVGMRVVVRSAAANERWDRGDFLPMFTACAELGFPVCVNVPGKLAGIASLAARLPTLPILIDHLGVAGPPTTPLHAGTLEPLTDVIALARFPNVSIKATGVSNLSTEPFPFRDIWPPLLRVISAYGPERVMWGSDITRILHPYAETVAYLAELPGLTEDDRALIYGGNTRRILRWPAPART